MNNNAVLRQQKGFTLLELVIAMAVFAVIMIMVMGGLNIVLKSQDQVSAKAKRLGELQMAVVVLVRDLNQIIERPVRNNAGDLTGVITINPKDLIRLEFTSGGNVNPNQMYQRSTLQRIGYGLDNENLIRFSWPVLDRVTETQMLRRHVLGGVVGFDAEFLNNKGEFVNDGSTAIAIYIDIDLGKDGHFQRTFPLYREVINAPKK